MTHADINDLPTRDYIFKIGDRGKVIQARYDENTDALIFPRAAFDYVCKLLNEALSREPKSGKWIKRQNIECSDLETAVNLRWRYECSECGYEVRSKCRFCPNCGSRMEGEGE